MNTIIKGLEELNLRLCFVFMHSNLHEVEMWYDWNRTFVFRMVAKWDFSHFPCQSHLTGESHHFCYGIFKYKFPFFVWSTFRSGSNSDSNIIRNNFVRFTSFYWIMYTRMIRIVSTKCSSRWHSNLTWIYTYCAILFYMFKFTWFCDEVILHTWIPLFLFYCWIIRDKKAKKKIALFRCSFDWGHWFIICWSKEYMK